jgi:outer membrane lipoprotein SlyB
MKKFLTLCAVVIIFLFTGCTQMYNSNEVSLNDVNTELSYQTGVVTEVKNVVIKDNGSGTAIGAYTGTVLGSVVGNGKGNILTTLIGGLTGAFLGNEMDKANAQELYIKLDDGRNIVTVVKGINVSPGDRVRIIKRGAKIVRVERI